MNRRSPSNVLSIVSATSTTARATRAARWAWTQALRTLDDLGHPDRDRVRAKIRVPEDRLPAVI